MRTLTIGSILAACVAVVSLAGCSNLYGPVPVQDTFSPVPSQELILETSDQLSSWTRYQTDDYVQEIAPTLGLTKLYDTKPELRRNNPGYSFVGTYGPGCIVAVGFDAKYAKTRLNMIDEANITMLSRYNPTTFWFHRERVDVQDVKGLLATQTDNCR